MQGKPWLTFLVGAAGGALLGAGVWYFASRQLDQKLEQSAAQMAADLGQGATQLRAELAAGRERLRADVVTQVQAHVPDALDERLRLYGITRALVQNVERVLAYGQRAGVL